MNLEVFALKPSPLSRPLASPAAEECVDMNSQSEKFLDQPLPELTGVDGTVFAVATDIDIRLGLGSPLLLDILADKRQASQQKRNVLHHPQPPPQEAAVRPKESEWSEW